MVRPRDVPARARGAALVAGARRRAGRPGSHAARPRVGDRRAVVVDDDRSSGDDRRRDRRGLPRRLGRRRVAAGSGSRPPAVEPSRHPAAARHVPGRRRGRAGRPRQRGRGVPHPRRLDGADARARGPRDGRQARVRLPRAARAPEAEGARAWRRRRVRVPAGSAADVREARRRRSGGPHRRA